MYYVYVLLQNMDLTAEENLQDLTKIHLPVTASDMANKIYQNTLLLKVLKLAVKDSVDRLKATPRAV